MPLPTADDHIQPNGKDRNLPTSGAVPLHVLVGHPSLHTEIRRAPDDGGGSPDVAAAVTIDDVPARGPFTYVDDGLPVDGAALFYQARHAGPGFDPSGWVPSGWLRAVARVIRRDIPDPPVYPLTQVEVSQPQNRPGNAAVRLRSWPEHPEIVLRSAYLALGATVPDRSDLAAWTSYAGEFEIPRDPSLNTKVAAYADLNGMHGPVTVVELGPDLRAQILDVTTTQIGDGDDDEAIVKICADVDAHTRQILVWRRRATGAVAWPTDDPSDPNAGLLDAYFKGPLPPDVACYEDGGYSTDDIVATVLVPVDALGVRGVRDATQYTVTGGGGGGGGDPAITSMSRFSLQAGTACGDQRQIRVTWSTANVTDGGHDIKFYRRLNGGAWTFVVRETSPSTVTQRDLDAGVFENLASPIVTVDVKAELVPNGGDTILDVEVMNEDDLFFSEVC